MSETDERGPLEIVYDEGITPLVVQIIAICKRANLPILASFQLDGDLACTTYIAPPLEEWPEDDREHYEGWRFATDRAERELMGEPARNPLMPTVRDASGAVTRMEAIL